MTLIRRRIKRRLISVSTVCIKLSNFYQRNIIAVIFNKINIILCPKISIQSRNETRKHLGIELTIQRLLYDNFLIIYMGKKPRSRRFNTQQGFKNGKRGSDIFVVILPFYCTANINGEIIINLLPKRLRLLVSPEDYKE